jgi:single-strand DNA-binding protein
MQKIQITGNIGKDAVARPLQNGQRDVINFTVACNEKWLDAQGVQQQRTTWYNCSYFRPQGKTAIAQYLKKSVSVFIEGTPSAKVYTPQQGGEPVASLEINVQVLELMGSAPSQSANAAPAQAAPQYQAPAPQQQAAPAYQQPATMNVGGFPATTAADDDLPF